MTILKKVLKHKSCLRLGTCHKHVQFTGQTPTSYWYAKRNELTFSNMPAVNTVQ